MREFYFATSIDLGSSGVACFSLGELRHLLGVEVSELDQITLDDSESFGDVELRGALADRFLDGDPRRVLATHGSSEAIFLAMNALLDRGDEVVAVDPGYHSLWSVAESVGCRLKRWRLRPEDDFAPDLGALRALVTPSTRMVVVNFPHNPTGVTLTPSQLDEFLDIVAGVGAYLVWDGALAELTYGSPTLPDPANHYDRCLSVGTMSKAYGLPGTRVGWCFGDPQVLETLLPLRDTVSICLSPLTQFLAARAVREADTLVGLRRAQAAHNRTVLARWLDDHQAVVDAPLPAGGVTAFPRVRHLRETDSLCRRLGDTHDVLLVPGACFGVPDRVRLGFGGPADEFETGLARLGEVLADSSVPLAGAAAR